MGVPEQLQHRVHPVQLHQLLHRPDPAGALVVYESVEVVEGFLVGHS